MPCALRPRPGGGDDGAAVAGAEVDQIVLGGDLGHVEHAVDEGLRRRHPHHVLTGWPDSGSYWPVEGWLSASTGAVGARASSDTNNAALKERIRRPPCDTLIAIVLVFRIVAKM